MFPALSCLWLLTFVDPDGQLASLVEKHQRYLDSIRTLEVLVQADVSDDSGRTWKRMGTVLWRKDGDRQRFTSTRYGEFSPFRPAGEDATCDYYTDPHESRQLQIRNARPPAELDLRKNFIKATGVIREPAVSVGHQGPPIWLYFLADSTLSLKGLHQIASKKKLLGKVSVDGAELWGIELENPETKHMVTVFLDPQRNHAIVKTETRVSPSPDTGGTQRVGVLRTLESREVKPGIYFPTHVQGGPPNGPNITDVRVLSIKVNEPLEENAFRIAFPRGAAVGNSKTGEVYIWGEDAPEVTFANNEMFEEWLRAQLGFGPGRTLTKFVLINVAFLTAIGVILYLRRRYAGKGLAS